MGKAITEGEGDGNGFLLELDWALSSFRAELG